MIFNCIAFHSTIRIVFWHRHETRGKKTEQQLWARLWKQFLRRINWTSCTCFFFTFFIFLDKLLTNAFKSVYRKSDLVYFLELVRCPKLKWIAKREASHLRSMFSRVPQTLVIPILRATCIHGDIVIHISFVHAQDNFQRGLQKVMMILHLFWHFWW